jgi:hypothetical protein
MSYALQSKTGIEQNKLYSEDTSIHDWYRFVLSFPPHLVRNYLDEFGIKNGDTVLDPFCGTGTTLIECKKRNIFSIGIEANPVAHLAMQAKTNWEINLDDFRTAIDTIANRTEISIKNHAGTLLILPAEKEKLLIKNSISPLPLHKSLLLINEIKKYSFTPFYEHLLVGFAKQLVASFSNLHFGPEVGVSRNIKTDAKVVELWYNQMLKMIDDLLFEESKFNSKPVLILGDARAINLDYKIDAVITSPPYPNEKDYTRTTRLESVVLDFIKSKDDLRAFKKNLLRSNTRNIYKADDDGIFIRHNKKIIELSTQIENRRIELNKTSGFEKYYHKVVELYFGGMFRHLKTLKPFLNKNAKLAYVLGDQASYFQILIKTSTLLSEVAEELGYKLERIDTFRTRLSTVTKNYLNEDVLILSNK